MMVARISLIVAVVALSEVALAGTYHEGATLPQYWKDRADEAGLDWSILGFNVTEPQWYYDGMPTCIGWGEFDSTCDHDTFVCPSYSGKSHGYGWQQIEFIVDMLAKGHDSHMLCPTCESASAGSVYVCHDGVKYEMPLGAAVAADFGNPGAQGLSGKGTWTTCDCEEVHRGYYLEEGTYFGDLAEAAGLDITLVSHYNGAWYYDMKYSCVAKGSYGAACDKLVQVCSSDDELTYGSGEQQMYELHAASQLPSGKHAYCPL